MFWTKAISATIFFGIAVGLSLYYSKTLRERQREETNEIIIRVFLPSLFFSMVFFGIIAHNARETFPIPFQSIFQGPKTYLNEPYFNNVS